MSSRGRSQGRGGRVLARIVERFAERAYMRPWRNTNLRADLLSC